MNTQKYVQNPKEEIPTTTCLMAMDEESFPFSEQFAVKETEKRFGYLSVDSKQESSDDSDYDTDLDAEGTNLQSSHQI